FDAGRALTVADGTGQWTLNAQPSVRDVRHGIPPPTNLPARPRTALAADGAGRRAGLRLAGRAGRPHDPRTTAPGRRRGVPVRHDPVFGAAAAGAVRRLHPPGPRLARPPTPYRRPLPRSSAARRSLDASERLSRPVLLPLLRPRQRVGRPGAARRVR